MYLELVIGVSSAILLTLVVLMLLGIPSFTIVYQGILLVIGLILVCLHAVEYVCWWMICCTMECIGNHWKSLVVLVIIGGIGFKMLTMVDEEDMCHMGFKEYILNVLHIWNSIKNFQWWSPRNAGQCVAFGLPSWQWVQCVLRPLWLRQIVFVLIDRVVLLVGWRRGWMRTFGVFMRKHVLPCVNLRDKSCQRVETVRKVCAMVHVWNIVAARGFIGATLPFIGIGCLRWILIRKRVIDTFIVLCTDRGTKRTSNRRLRFCNPINAHGTNIMMIQILWRVYNLAHVNNIIQVASQMTMEIYELQA